MLFKKNRIPRGYMVLEDTKPSKHRGSRAFVVWMIALLTLFGSAIFFSQLASAEEGVSPNNAESGQLLFTATSGYTQAIHLKTDVDVEINGMVAKVTYRQKFRNESLDWQEAVYVFPLAENAAVNHMEMILGDRRILSQIKEREEAKRIYTEAKNNGQRAALTEQQRPNLFTQRVANIAPGEEISVELQFVQQLGYQHGAFEFHLPTTLTPRYIPGVEIVSFEEKKQFQSQSTGWGVPTNEVTDAAEITPRMKSSAFGEIINPISLRVQLNAGLLLSEITSPYHEITQARIGDIYEIELAEGTVSMDRDFRLSWRPTPSNTPEAAVFAEQIDGENYLLMMLMPPQVQSSTESIPREMIFIVDTSGSMQGTSIVQAKQSLQMALARLTPNDRFNLIEFNSNHRALFANPVQASASNLQIAKNFVGALSADGGTNMQPALEAALRGTAPESYLKQVVFITDGSVGNEAALFKLIEDQLGDARLFTVGIGSAPNSYFMSKAAQFGRGSFTYVGDAAEVHARMSALFLQLESPVLSDLEIHWPESAEQYPARTPDLYAGSPLVLTAKVPALTGEVVVQGKAVTQNWERSLNLEIPESASASGVGTIWGRSKIESLMDEKIRGRNEAEVREEVLKVALPLNLVSRYTSLVAVEEKIARNAETPVKKSSVPNAVANGQVQQPGTYPGTATWMPFNLLVGSLLLALWLLARRRGLA